MATIANSPVLIAELTDLFIDHLWDDKHALASCSLVAKSWVNRSRFHLFNSVTVKTAEGLQGFRDIVSSVPACRHIQSLSLENPKVDFQKSHYRLSPSYISLLVRSLPALCSFTVQCLWWDSTEEAESSPIPEASPSVVSGSCRMINLMNFISTHSETYGKPLSVAEVSSFLQFFPNIISLTHYSNGYVDKHELSPSHLVPHRSMTAKNLRLQRLRLVSTYLETPMLQFIIQTESMQTLQILELCLSSFEAAIVAQELLCKTAATLKLLVFGFASPRPMSMDEALLIPQAFDLSVCSALRVLQFTGPISDTLEVRLSQWAFLCTLLQQIPPHTSPKFQLQINYSLNGVSRKKVEDAIEDLGRLPVPSAQLGELLRRPTIVYIRFRDVGSEVGRLQSGSLWRAFSVKFPSLVEEGRLKSITG